MVICDWCLKMKCFDRRDLPFFIMTVIILITAGSVSCQQHGDLRLAGYGSNNLAGRLEIYYNDQWGTICGGIKFNLLTASVACRQLGLGPAISFTYYPDLRFGIGVANISLGEVICTGEESHLLRCLYKPATQLPQCFHYHDVGIMCSRILSPYSGAVQLYSSSSYTSIGLLQLYLYGNWRPVCSDGINQEAIDTVCRQLGYTHAVSNNTIPLLSGTKTWIVSSSCTVNDTCFSKCLDNLPASNDVTVCNNGVKIECGFNASQANVMLSGNHASCELYTPFSGDVRMTSLSNDGLQGIPEIYKDGTWKKTCLDSKFSWLVADVLCKQMGYTLALRYDKASGTSVDSGVQLSCTGVENSVSECPEIATISQCSQFVELRCNNELPQYGSLKLFNGAGSTGALHIFVENQFHPVCDTSFGHEELNVVCRQLGFQSGLQIINNSLHGLSNHTHSAYNYTFSCTGTEKHLLGCDTTKILPSDSTTCRYPYDTVAVQCSTSGLLGSSPARLTGGNSTSGRLEVHLNNTWGTVCGLDFDHLAAHVACREIGFETATGYKLDSDSNTLLPIQLTSINCSGFESELKSCSHTIADDGTCQHKHDVYLYCSREYPVQDGTIRLAGSQTSLSGRLEIAFHGLWMSVCGHFFNKQAANVACKQLGYSYAESYCTDACNGSGNGYILFAEMYCTGNELKLIECEREIHNHNFCSHQNDVGIMCSKNNIESSSSLLPSPTATINTTPTEGGLDPTPTSEFFLPISKVMFYSIASVIGFIILVVCPLCIIICCCCVCPCKTKTVWREAPVIAEETNMASPRAINPAYNMSNSPPLSSINVSLEEVAANDSKDMTMLNLDDSFLTTSTAGSSSVFHRPPLSINGATPIAPPTQDHPPFDETDFGLEEPPRYDELDFKSLPHSCYSNGTGAMATGPENADSSQYRVDQEELEKDKGVLEGGNVHPNDL